MSLKPVWATLESPVSTKPNPFEEDKGQEVVRRETRVRQ